MISETKSRLRKIYATIGASNHAGHERETNDYYATDPRAAGALLSVESFAPWIWECACGAGHLAKVFTAAGYIVKATDLGFFKAHELRAWREF